MEPWAGQQVFQETLYNMAIEIDPITHRNFTIAFFYYFYSPYNPQIVPRFLSIAYITHLQRPRL